MKENKTSNNRRKLLKSIAAGSGAIVAGKSLPESWTRPVVDSVLLPAHAQTSPPPPSGPAGGSTEITVGSIENSDSMFAHVTSALVKSAHAIAVVDLLRWTFCVTPATDPGIYTVQLMFLERNSDSSFINTWTAAHSLDLAIGETKTIPFNQITMTCGNMWTPDVFVTLDSYADGSGSVGIGISSQPSATTVSFYPGGCMLDTPTAVGCVA